MKAKRADNSFDIKVTLTSDSTFTVRIRDRDESGGKILFCHDSGENIERENRLIIDTIRSRVGSMRAPKEEHKFICVECGKHLFCRWTGSCSDQNIIERLYECSGCGAAFQTEEIDGCESLPSRYFFG